MTNSHRIVMNSTISGNVASGIGGESGGIISGLGAPITITNSTISYNSASEGVASKMKDR